MSYIENLAASVFVMNHLGGQPLPLPDGGPDLGAWAVWYALKGWKVFPLKPREKVPATRNGFKDATDDLRTVIMWWGPQPNMNIGLVPADDVFVIDIDPRHDGDKHWDKLRLKLKLSERETLETISGRGDGGRHLFYRKRSDSTMTAKRLQGTGIDLKQSNGYVLGAPSVHPDSGRQYQRIDRPIAEAQIALWEHLIEVGDAQAERRERWQGNDTQEITGIADWFSSTISWVEILEPAGWQLVLGSGDEDGSCWKHPAATSALSATVRHGVLFVYSPNTPFDVTEPGNPHGYTRFAAYALLEHGGNQSEAAHGAMSIRKGRL